MQRTNTKGTKVLLNSWRKRRAAGKNTPQFVAGFARIQLVLNSCEFSYGSFHSAARLTALIWICITFPLGCTRPFKDPSAPGLFAASREKLFPKKEMGQDRLWRPDLAIMPFAEFQDEDIVIKHVRNCRYRTETDYDVRHYDMRFALADVNRIDFLIVPFQNNSLLAHTMFSFGLRDGRHFIISVEARLDYGASYSPIRGITNKFELMYLIGDERDLIPLRTEARKAEVYLYPGRATPDQVQNLLVDMLERANQLQRVPENYDTIKNNCTTNLVNHINKLRPGSIPADWRVLLPGHSDRLAYELGLLDVVEPFEIAREKARITSVANMYTDSPDFSAKIREHIGY